MVRQSSHMQIEIWMCFSGYFHMNTQNNELWTWWKYGTHKRNRMRRLNALRENHFNWILKGKRNGVWNSLLAYVQHRGASILSDMNMRCDEYWTKFQLRAILWQDFFYNKIWNMRQSQATFFVIEKRIGQKKMYYNIWQFVLLTWSATKWNVAIMYSALRT